MDVHCISLTICNNLLFYSLYLSELPLVLVFGIATAVTTIHRVLPHAVSSVLSIERFQSQPSHICVLEIISKVVRYSAQFLFLNFDYSKRAWLKKGIETSVVETSSQFMGKVGLSMPRRVMFKL